MRSATFWMAIQSGVVLAAFAVSPRSELILRNDSRLYVRLAREASFEGMLASIRTPGYPLFLRAVEGFCPGLRCLPMVQLSLYGLATVGLCAALRRFGLSGWGALAAATPLLYSSLIPYMAPSAMTEVPAAALALLTLSLLLRVLTAPGSRLLWAALGLTLFLAWQMRPAYVFLALLLPVGGWALAVLQRGRWTARSAARRLLLPLAALTLLPLLGWCGLRWWRVDHFGLVAFTGHNLSGIAASMLDEEVIARLPVDQRDLAQAILAQRRLRGLEPVDAASPLAAWWDAYIHNSWRIAIPLTRRRWREAVRSGTPPPDPNLPRDMAVDRHLTALSLAVIRQRPGLYAVWLLRSWSYALGRTASNPWIWGPAAAIVLALAVGGARRRQPEPGRAEDGRQGCGAAPALGRSLAWLAFSLAFYLLSLALVLLVEPPEWRYLSATDLLLPGALSALALELWRDLRTEPTGAGAEAAPAEP